MCIRCCCQKDTIIGMNGALSIGKSIGHLFGHEIMVKSGMGICNERILTEADQFKKLMDCESNKRVNSVLRKKTNRIMRHKVEVIPVTQDLVLLRNWLYTHMKLRLRKLYECPLQKIGLTCVR